MQSAVKGVLNILLRKRYSFAELAVFFLVALFALFLALDSVTPWFIHRATKTPLPEIHIAGEADSPVEDAYSKPYEFSDDMFSPNIPVWEELVVPLKGKPGLHYLEIGVHEGRSALWMLENVLTHPTSHLTGVDIFADEYRGRSGGYRETYLANLELSEAAERTTTIEGSSQIVLRTLPLGSFDLIYVDGSHQNADVLEDSVLCWRLLKDGGLLIFDDYGAEAGHPKLGIEAFTQFFGDHFNVLHNSYQLILKKKYQRETAAAGSN